MNPFYQMLSAVEILVQGLLLVLLLRGPFRKYTVFALYVLVEFVAGVTEEIAYYRVGWQSPAYREVYWTDQVALDLLLFLVVIALTYAALQGNPLRPKAAKALGIIVTVTLALPFAILRGHHSPRHGPFTSQWFNHASQIWNFGAAIMNLVPVGRALVEPAPRPRTCHAEHWRRHRGDQRCYRLGRAPMALRGQSLARGHVHERYLPREPCAVVLGVPAQKPLAFPPPSGGLITPS